MAPIKELAPVDDDNVFVTLYAHCPTPNSQAPSP